MVQVANAVKRIQKELNIGEYVDVAKSFKVSDSHCLLLNTIIENPTLAGYIVRILNNAENVLTCDGFDADEVSVCLYDALMGTGLTQRVAFTMLSRRLHQQFTIRVVNVMGHAHAGDEEWFTKNASKEGLVNVPGDAQNISEFATDLYAIIKPILNIKGFVDPDRKKDGE